MLVLGKNEPKNVIFLGKKEESVTIELSLSIKKKFNGIFYKKIKSQFIINQMFTNIFPKTCFKKIFVKKLEFKSCGD